MPFRTNLLSLKYRLLRKDTPWIWPQECEDALNEVKWKFISSPVLVHYDPKKPITVACDASPHGIGAVLSHIMENSDERPVAYGSRTLKPEERNYALLEKEVLSIVFGVKRFHKYVYGRKFKLITDHKPFTTILGPKTGILTLARQRLQRWPLILSAHNYKIEYRSSAEHANADTFSCLPLEDDSEVATELEINYFSYMDELPISAKQIAEGTRKDPVLGKVYELTLNG